MFNTKKNVIFCGVATQLHNTQSPRIHISTYVFSVPRLQPLPVNYSISITSSKLVKTHSNSIIPSTQQKIMLNYD